MLSFDHPALTRQLARIGCAAALTLCLGGCFQPLYGTVGGHLAEELQAVAVDPVPDRVGHYLTNELVFAFNGTGTDVVPKYRLFVTVTTSVQTPLIDTFASRASAATVVLNANYRLMPAGGGASIASGTATNIASYDRSSQRFANIRAARNAEIRVAKTLADEIRLRISAALASRG